MRQGYGIARMYFRATPDGRRRRRAIITADLVDLSRADLRDRRALGDDGRHVPGLAGEGAGPAARRLPLLGFAAAAAGVGVAGSDAVAPRGTLDLLYAGFVLSHIAIFLVAYVVVEDVNTGWLAINVWHNFQYVLVVWMSNAKTLCRRRQSGGAVPVAHQPARAAW